MDTNNNWNYQSFDKVRLIAERYQTEKIFSALRETLEQAETDGIKLVCIKDLKEFLDWCETAVLEAVESETIELGYDVNELNDIYLALNKTDKPIA